MVERDAELDQALERLSHLAPRGLPCRLQHLVDFEKEGRVPEGGRPGDGARDLPGRRVGGREAVGRARREGPSRVLDDRLGPWRVHGEERRAVDLDQVPGGQPRADFGRGSGVRRGEPGEGRGGRGLVEAGDGELGEGVPER